MDLAIQIEKRTFFKRIDWNFVFIILALNIVGLMNLYSATHGPNSQNMETLFANQIIWLSAGWSIFFILTLIEYQFIVKLAYLFYFINLGAIVFTTFYGVAALGAQRWIDLGFFRYQPSETMKLAIILVLARTLSNKTITARGLGFRDLLFPLLLILIPTGLVVEQPDFGTAMLLLAIGGTLLLMAKIRPIILWIVILSGLTAAPIMWNYVLRDYQKARVTNFLSPQNDPKGKGYNSIQSRIAVGSGQFLGKGFRKGTQSQLEFLPERHTDFIFSVLSEEHGFIGSLGTVALFMALFLFGIRIGCTARDKLGALLTAGILAYIFWHMAINIGMVIGMLPIVGVPLPLLSYGGSSMLTTMVGLGLISSVAYRRYLF